jgi:hypothetical protein
MKHLFTSFGLLMSLSLSAQEMGSVDLKIPYEIFEGKILCSYQNCSDVNGQMECEGSKVHFDEETMKRMTKAVKDGNEISTNIGKLGLMLSVGRLYVVKKCTNKLPFEGSIWWSDSEAKKHLFETKGETIRIITYKYASNLEKIIENLVK